ncbi:PRC-barrel domain-containing protein [Pedobacter cryoconitis]|uniref:PRC-barrel domain protein n=1 Tax=Pedobacter cryoconitis TaxID=188932 RepID=A0A327SYV5_9SPHI|nr:PRC-barrel domain-containing protein [Pedobacter cryoconitis]RAJ33435.1 PRC-barrel domain protein [Pedobacter cryoconitis]
MEREESQHHLKNLTELNTSTYAVRAGQPSLTNWTVVNSARQFIGTVRDLLIDDQPRARYLILNLTGNIWNIEEREVLIPISAAELHRHTQEVMLPNITSQQISALPDYIQGNVIISTDSEIYGHKDTDQASAVAKEAHGSYPEHIPFQVITRVYQEEAEAENAFKLLLKRGFSESDIKITPYNPLNSVTDIQGNTNTQFLGDGSRDEYILSLAANSALDAVLAQQLLNNTI